MSNSVVVKLVLAKKPGEKSLIKSTFADSFDVCVDRICREWDMDIVHCCSIGLHGNFVKLYAQDIEMVNDFAPRPRYVFKLTVDKSGRVKLIFKDKKVGKKELYTEEKDIAQNINTIFEGDGIVYKMLPEMVSMTTTPILRTRTQYYIE